MISAQKITEDYVKHHPSIRDCLVKDLINFSKLSRKICNEEKIEEGFDAVLISLRRISRLIKKESTVEEDVLGIIRNARLDVRGNIFVVVMDKDSIIDSLKFDFMHSFRGENSLVVITDSQGVKLLKKNMKSKIVKINENACEILLKSNLKIENVRGVMSYLTSILASQGINLMEIMSVWNETILIIAEKDLAKTIEILKT